MPPIRTCVGCRRTDEQARLVRLVVDGAGRIKIDLRRLLPGRGAWVHRSRECVGELVRRDALARSFRRKLERVTEDEMWSRIGAGARDETDVTGNATEAKAAQGSEPETKT